MPDATPDLTIKRNDTYPPLTAVLKQNGTTIDLTTATSVEIIMKSTTLEEPILVTGTCTISDAPSGSITYNWGTTDLAVSDVYDVEFQIEWTGGGQQTIPNDDYNSIEVVDDLDDQ
jgi:hypothetical protein